MSESLQTFEALREKVSVLFENFPDIFDRSFEKVEFVLTLLGEKPANDIGIYPLPNRSGEGRKMYIQAFIHELESFGFTVVHMASDSLEKKRDFLNGCDWVFYSFDKQKADRISEIMFSENDQEEAQNAKELGSLLGYPETAAKAYAEETSSQKPNKEESPLFKVEEEPPEVKAAEWYPFLQFRISKMHWREEVETAKRWANVIKNFDANLYKDLIKDANANN